MTGGIFASYLPGLVEKLPILDTAFFVGPINGIIVSLITYSLLGLGQEEAAETTLGKEPI